MGKKFVIMEVERDPLGDWRPVGMPEDDGTVIDERHVIDGERLRYNFPVGEKAFTHDGWQNGVTNTVHHRLILDPPKEEDEWEQEK